MPKIADEPLKKVTLNIYEADYEAMKFYYGWGWSEQIRRIVKDFVAARRRATDQMRGVL